MEWKSFQLSYAANARQITLPGRPGSFTLCYLRVPVNDDSRERR